MSRHGYCDDLDQRDLAMYRGRVWSAIRGKRGQKLLVDLRDALDAMPEKKLIRHHLQTPDGCCALGCVGQKRGLDFTNLDPDDANSILADKLNVAEVLIREVEFENDDFSGSPEKRWEYIRGWVDRLINSDEVGK